MAVASTAVAAFAGIITLWTKSALAAALCGWAMGLALVHKEYTYRTFGILRDLGRSVKHKKMKLERVAGGH